MKTELGIRQVRESDPSALSHDDLTRLVNRCLQEEDFAHAYRYVARLAEITRDNPRTSVMAGLVALKLDRNEQAAGHFKRALDACPDDYDANYNLALVELQIGEPAQALWRLRHLTRLTPRRAGLYNDMAILWMNLQRDARAEANFRRALKVDPEYSQARNNAMEFFLERQLFDRGKKLLAFQEDDDTLTPRSRAEINRWKEIIADAEKSAAEQTSPEAESPPGPVATVHPQRIGKIAVFASYRTFIEDIIRSLSESNEVRVSNGQKTRQVSDLMEWADIAFFEWCDAVIIEAVKLPKRCRIVCRLHSYEAFTDMPSKVDWGKVDHLIFVNESVRDIFRRQVGAEVPTSVIHNGVDLDRFVIPQGKQHGKKIASVGYINYKKNPALLLYCFKKIHEHDPAYTLHIAGTHQDPRIALYFRHFLKQNPLPVHFDGWVEDMPKWYADKDFVISTSLFESFHYSVAEGMASGLMPLVHNWYGAKNLYPETALFNDPDECLELVKGLEKTDHQALAMQNRKYVAGRFDLKQQTDKITRLLLSLTASPVGSGAGD